MQQDPDQAEKEDDKASTGRISSLDFNFLSDFENGTDTLEATTEPADEEISTLEPSSAFMETNRNLPESSSPSNSKNIEKNYWNHQGEKEKRALPEYLSWEPCPKKNGKFIIETKTGRIAVWTDLPS